VTSDCAADTDSEFGRDCDWNPELEQWFTVCCNTKLPSYAVTWTQAAHW